MKYLSLPHLAKYYDVHPDTLRRMFRTINIIKDEHFIMIGKAVRFNVEKMHSLIIHDDIDLLFGDVRVSKDSSSAGHKGVQSIIDELGTKNFTRVRIGISPELKIKSQKLKIDTTNFVLKNFSRAEEKKLPEIIKKAVGLIPIPLS